MGPLFDMEDGDFVYDMGGNMLRDSDGDLMMRMSDNMAMDMDSGEIHFLSGGSGSSSIWDDEDD